MAKPEVAISLGGNLINPEAGRVNKEYLHQFATLSSELVNRGYSLIIACGGGATARANIEYGRKVLRIQAAEELDRIGIEATHLNTVALTHFLQEKGLKVSCLLESKILAEEADILTTGGDKPGHTTDFVTVKMAIEQGVKTPILNLTNGPVYERRPDGQPDFEKPVKKMTWEEYQQMFPLEHEPGINVPFDSVPSQLAKEHQKTVVILDGRDLDNVRKYLVGENVIGTIISDEINTGF